MDDKGTSFFKRVTEWFGKKYKSYAEGRVLQIQESAQEELRLLIANHQDRQGNLFGRPDDVAATGRKIVAGWDNLKKIEAGLNRNTHAKAAQTLENVAIDKFRTYQNSQDGDALARQVSNTLTMDQEVLSVLNAKVPAVVDDLISDLRSAFDTDMTALEQRFKGRLEKWGLGAAKIDKLVANFAGQVSDHGAAFPNGLSQDAKEAAAAALKTSIKAAYLAELRSQEEIFIATRLPALRGAMWRQSYEPAVVSKIFVEDDRISHDEISPTYLLTHEHLLDRMVNNAALECTPEGNLYFKSRAFVDGGAFEFEKGWAWQSKEFKEKLKATGEAPPRSDRTKARTEMFFVDKIALTGAARDVLKTKLNIEFHADGAAANSIVAFAGKVRRMHLDIDDVKCAEIEGVSDYVGFQILSDWLSKNVARRISVSIGSDGLLHMVLQQEEPANQTKTISRAQDNTLRLMVQLAVALVDHAANGAEGQRAYPTKLSSSKGMDIPCQVVWPLEISCKDPMLDKVATGMDLAVSMSKANWEPAPLENWMLGCSQVSDQPKPWFEVLEQRFEIVTQQQVQVLRAPEQSNSRRAGLITKDALGRLVKFFNRTSVVLCGIWIGSVILTVWTAADYSERELWILSLAFALIGIWRFSLVAILTSVQRRSTIERRPATKLIKLLQWVLSRSLGYRPMLLLGPVLLATVAVCAAVTKHHFGFPEEGFKEVLGKAGLGDLDTDSSSFRKTLHSGVWALPILTMGLLRQASVTLSELLVDRDQVQLRLNTLRAIESNWRAGQEIYSSVDKKDDPIGESISRLKAKFKSQSEQLSRLFGEKSAANIASVALLSVLGPLANMEPKTTTDTSVDTQKLTSLGESIASLGYVRQATADVRVASFGISALPEATETVLLPRDSCASLNGEYWITNAKREMTPTRQAIFVLNLMHCLEKNAVQRQRDMTQFQKEFFHQQDTVVAILEEIKEALNERGKGDVHKTYLCLLSFGKHCVQDSQVDVSAEGLGKVAFDFKGLTEDAKDAAKAIADLKGPHTVRLHTDTIPLYDSIAQINDVMSITTKPRRVTLNAKTDAASQDLDALIAKIAMVPKERSTLFDAEVDPALEEIRRLLDLLGDFSDPLITPKVAPDEATKALNKLLELTDQLTRRHKVNLSANANDLYQEIGLARRVLETLPKRQNVTVYGDKAIPLVDIDIDLTLPGAPSGVPAALRSCEKLARRSFGTNSPNGLKRNERFSMWAPQKWSIGGVPLDGSPDEIKAAVRARLQDEQNPGGEKILYVLGLADGRGTPAYNLRLSQQRADLIAKAVEDLAPGRAVTPLTLGEHGWLTTVGLPESEDDQKHRNATIYGCRAPLN